ncbi:MFS family permease [Oxalobacteraceae bacterium GrIS 2.11]
MQFFKNFSSKTDSIHSIQYKVKFHILPLLVVGFIFAYIDRTNISFAHIKMREDLLFGDAVYGFGAGIFFVGYLLFEIPSNMLLHKIGARIWISRIMVTWGIVSGATIFVSTPMQFYVMRFLLGVAEAGFFPGVILYLTYWFPAKQIRSVSALFITAIPASGLVGSFLSGWILEILSNDVVMKSWQWLFLLEAVPSIFLGLLLYKVLPNGIYDASFLNTKEKRILSETLDFENSEKSSLRFVELILDRRIWILIVMGGSFSVGMYGILFWLPSIVKSSGITGDFRIGLLSSIPWLCSILGMLVLSNLPASSNNKKRVYIVFPGLLSAGSLIMSVIFHDDIVLAIGFLSLAATGIMCVFPGFWSLSSFLGGASAASGIALINSMSNLCGFFSPAITGRMIETTHSTTSSVYLMAGFIAFGCAIAFLFPVGASNEEY